MRWLKSAIRVESRVVEDNIKVAIAQCSAGRVEIEFRNGVRDFTDGFSILCVEPQRVKAKCEPGSAELRENILVSEQKEVVHVIKS